jgi:Zn-dependent M16 (insulinase) family peptidase
VEILREKVSGMEASIVSSGHSYAAARIGARHSLLGAFNETTGGISYLHSARAMLDEAESEEGWPVLRARLEAMRASLLTACRPGEGGDASERSRFMVNVTADAPILEAITGSSGAGGAAAAAAAGPAAGYFDSFLSRLAAAAPAAPSGLDRSRAWGSGARLAAAEGPAGSGKPEGFVVQTQVNYVGLGGRLLAPGDAVPGASAVAGNLLNTGYLWEKVRVMGGAYGAMYGLGGATGSLTFLSYRDPNLADTFSAYEAAGESLAAMSNELTDEDLELAIIGACRRVRGMSGCVWVDAITDIDPRLIAAGCSVVSLLMRSVRSDVPPPRFPYMRRCASSGALR